MADEFARLHYAIKVFRNNWDPHSALQYIKENKPEAIVFSPGPGHPNQALLCHAILEACEENQLVIGICLGHQVIIEHFGGKVEKTNKLMHGKASLISHDKKSEFSGLSHPLQVARYHSLAASHLSDQLIQTAQIDNVTMAVRHVNRPIIGFQFHPESVLTPEGSLLLRNMMEHYHG